MQAEALQQFAFFQDVIVYETEYEKKRKKNFVSSGQRRINSESVSDELSDYNKGNLMNFYVLLHKNNCLIE